MQAFETITESNFIGLVDRFPSYAIPPGAFQKFDNALVDDNKIIKRAGTVAIGISLGAQNTLGLSAFEPNGGTKLIVACRNGASNAQLYTSVGGNFSAIGSANLTKDLQMNFTQASNYLFGFNGTDEVDYDGTTVTKNRAGVPKGQFSFWFHNYLFVGGVTGNPNRLYWSNLGNPLVFSAADYIDINANDGDFLTGLNALNDELVIFKNYSIWAITGWSGSSFAATTATGQNTINKALGVGTPSHQSIINTGRDLYYLSFNGQIPHFRSMHQTVFAKIVDQGVISFDILNTMNGLNKSQLSKAAAIFDGKYIYWALPNGSSTTNNLVVVLYPGRTFNTKVGILHQWATWSGITPSQYCVSTISNQAKIYFGDATTGGFVFQQGASVFSDNGVAIVMDIQTRDFSIDAIHEAKWKYLEHRHKTGSAGTLVMGGRIDKAAAFTTMDTMSLRGNSPGLGPTGTFTLGSSTLGGTDIFKHTVTLAQMTGTNLGIQFLESTANSCELYDFSLLAFKKGFRVHMG